MQSWHEHGVMKQIERMLCASTAHVMMVTLPRIIIVDGVKSPDALEFTVPPESIPPDMYAKAHAIVRRASTDIWSDWATDNGGRYVFYVLSQTQKDFSKLTSHMIRRCVLSAVGYEHARPPGRECVQCIMNNE